MLYTAQCHLKFNTPSTREIFLKIFNI